MSGYIGARLYDVLSQTDYSQQAAGMTPGQVVEAPDSSGRMGKYMCCLAVSGSNFVTGNVVSIDGSYNATILASGPAAPAGVNSALVLGVCVNTATASTSQLFFAQIFGAGSVRTTDLTASNLPGHMMVAGSTPGELKCLSGTASAYISGIVLTATASTATLSACFINFPRIAVA